MSCSPPEVLVNMRNKNTHVQLRRRENYPNSRKAALHLLKMKSAFPVAILVLDMTLKETWPALCAAKAEAWDVRSCLLLQPTGAAPRKISQELELDSTSLQAVGPGQRLLSLSVPGCWGGLAWCSSKPHLSGGGAGVCRQILKQAWSILFTQAWCPSANTSQCLHQVALRRRHMKARVTFCPNCFSSSGSG